MGKRIESAGGAVDQPASSVERFRQRVRGEVVLPVDAGYECARKVWNGAIDRRPAIIVYCADANDVIEAVNFARSGNYIVAVRSGGHNVAGLSVCDQGIVIDLSRMKRIEVDPVRRIARHLLAGAALLLEIPIPGRTHRRCHRHNAQRLRERALRHIAARVAAGWRGDRADVEIGNGLCEP
ncbi:FAD-dependent oxidoreductase [Paraburkholderia sp. BL10I2N1]|uniref:FAD-binding oxidoreductase n=1 Tax=Paraburkholderia sp. BL10I2N1 TaxID=1938796 RepID=UPI001FB5770A|nr:FAD-dependent oxidoreductase [Paraburkholderia sp. BL10I2N1]